VAAALPGATLDGDDYLGDVEGKPTVAELARKIHGRLADVEQTVEMT